MNDKMYSDISGSGSRDGFGVDINIPLPAPIPSFKIGENINSINSDFPHQNWDRAGEYLRVWVILSCLLSIYYRMHIS
jgi:hypothetical protein